MTDVLKLKLMVDLGNISITGMYVKTDQKLPKDTPCTIEIVISGRDSRLVIDSIQAVVVRNDSEGIGFSFISNMEWYALFNIYTHYGNADYLEKHQEDGERRQGLGDRRRGNFDRRRSRSS